MNRLNPQVYLGKFSLIILALLLLTSCKNKEKVASSEEKEPVNYANLVEAKVLNYSAKERGCSFLLQLEDERLLQPMKLPEEFKEDGLEVLIQYTPSRRPQGDCLIGTPIIINEIKRKS